MRRTVNCLKLRRTVTVLLLPLLVSSCVTLGGKSTKVGVYDQEDHLLLEVGEELTCPRDGYYISDFGAKLVDDMQGKEVFLQYGETIIPCSAGELVKCPYQGEFWSKYYSSEVIGVKVRSRK